MGQTTTSSVFDVPLPTETIRDFYNAKKAEDQVKHFQKHNLMAYIVKRTDEELFQTIYQVRVEQFPLTKWSAGPQKIYGKDNAEHFASVLRRLNFTVIISDEAEDGYYYVLVGETVNPALFK